MSDQQQPVPPWQPTGEEIMQGIESGSRERRSDCPGFLTGFFEMYAPDASVESLIQGWDDLVNRFPWFADDVLHCLDRLLADQSTPLPELIVEVAELNLEDSEGKSTSRQAAARTWLRDLFVPLRARFEELSTSPE